MSERDRFSREELGEVLSHYDVGVIRSAKELPRGSRRAPKLLLDSPRGRFLLKRRAGGRDDPARVAFTHALLAHLRTRHFPVPELVCTCDDQATMLQVGDHVYEVFQFVEGERCGDSLEETTHAGHTLARFHQAAAGFQPAWIPSPTSYHNAPNVRAGLNAIPTVAATSDGAPNHEAELLQLTQYLHEDYDHAAEIVQQAGFAEWPTTIVHGDWHPGNLVYREGRVCAVLDFDAARVLPAILDVAYGMLQFSILRAAAAPDEWPDFFDESRMRRFLKGYVGVLPLPAGHRRVVPALMVEALIAEAALPIAVTGLFGDLAGHGVLQMVARKIKWLQDNSDRMRRWLLLE
jgi:Ser/Thr protein kinase RdoA (MazF antagonist)